MTVGGAPASGATMSWAGSAAGAADGAAGGRGRGPGRPAAGPRPGPAAAGRGLGRGGGGGGASPVRRRWGAPPRPPTPWICRVWSAWIASRYGSMVRTIWSTWVGSRASPSTTTLFRIWVRCRLASGNRTLQPAAQQAQVGDDVDLEVVRPAVGGGHRQVGHADPLADDPDLPGADDDELDDRRVADGDQRGGVPGGEVLPGRQDPPLADEDLERGVVGAQALDEFGHRPVGPRRAGAAPRGSPSRPAGRGRRRPGPRAPRGGRSIGGGGAGWAAARWPGHAPRIRAVSHGPSRDGGRILPIRTRGVGGIVMGPAEIPGDGPSTGSPQGRRFRRRRQDGAPGPRQERRRPESGAFPSRRRSAAE